MTAKISGGSASLLLTSIRSQESAVLSVDLRKLDIKEQTVGAGARLAAADDGLLEDRVASDPAARVLPIRVLVHVQNTGDLEFTRSWAGRTDERLWIEAFTASCMEPDAADLIEYRGVTADGFSTPWLSNELLCGSRGRGMPLTAFAIRIKPEAVEQYECVYRGRFASGAVSRLL